MTQVEIIKGVTLSSLAESAPTRMGNIWQSGHQRTQILILIQRRHRQRFEGHSATVGLKHPCWAIFYRPRVEAEQIQECGLDPKSASFMFLDIALEDLGKWVGPLVKDEWPKEELIIAPAENCEFTATKWTTFRDPWLDSLEVLPLAFAPHDIEGKAWITNPSTSGTAPVTQATASTPSTQADSDFAGKLADLTHSFGTAAKTTTEANTTPPVASPEPAAPAFVMPTGPISIPNFGGSTPVAEVEQIAAPAEVIPEPAAPAAATYISPQPVEVPEITNNPAPVEVQNEPEVVNVEADSSDESEEDGGLEIKEELVDIIQLLIAGGLEPDQVMESPAFQEVSERATAAGLDVWSIFVENAS
ncbi:MAG: hypothetical protein QGI36_02725 [Candidatus Thalassarchaeaceae archaeon]|nr:hypothetical protein [Candidatus Thalassarchaeaceae archaeon]